MRGKIYPLLVSALLIGMLAGCNLPSPLPTGTPPPATLTHTSVAPTAAPTATPAPTLTSTPPESAPIPPTPTAVVIATPAQTCQVTALAATEVYMLPYTSARIFGTLASGEAVTIMASTAGGWFGFDPGVAQAGNVGIFRNRWIKESPSLSISPDCYNLAQVYTRIPQPGVCYAMIMAAVPVHSAPSAASTASAVLNMGDWAAALGVSGDWLKVSLADSAIAQPGEGWISMDVVGFNACDFPLPTTTP